MKLTFSVQEFNEIASSVLAKNGLDKDLVSLKVYEEDDKLVGITTSKFFIRNIVGLFSSDSYVQCRVERVMGNDIYLRVCNSLTWAAKVFNLISDIVTVNDDVVILHLDKLEAVKPYLPMVTIESLYFPGETVEVNCTVHLSAF